MNDMGWVFAAFIAGCLGMLSIRLVEKMWARRRPPRDTAELLNRIASVAHPLIEARLTVAWHEAELARLIDNVPPVFEDQVMLAAQLGQAIEQSVMREVQRQGIPIVRLSEARSAGYSGWASKWLRRDIVEAPSDPQLPERAMPSSPPPPTPRPTTSRPTTPPSLEGPSLIFVNGSWIPRSTPRS